MPMIKWLFIICLFTVIPLTTGAQDFSSSINRADALYDAWQFQEAMEALHELYQVDSTSYDVLWRLARAMTEVTDRLADDEKTLKEQLYEATQRTAQRAIDVHPVGSEGYLRLAIARGRLALFKGGRTKIELSKGVKAAVEKAIECDSTYYLPYYVYGRWHRELANLNFFLKAAAKIVYGGLPPASNEEALANFERSVELNPDYIEAHYFLGEQYIKMKQNEKAKAVLERCITLEPEREGDADYQESARKLLEKL